MSQPSVPPPVDRLAHFRRIRESLAPARDPLRALEEGAYVERPGANAPRIAAELLLAPSSHVLIGGIGSGKTTELFAIQQILTGSPDTVGLYVDASSGHDLADAKPGVVLAQVGLALVNWVQSARPKLAAGLGKFPAQRIREWAHGFVDPVDDDPPDLDSIFYPETPGILKPEPIPHATMTGIQLLRGLLEAIAEVPNAIDAKPPRFVALVDGLDRMTEMQRFEELVRSDIRALASLDVGVVLVGPLRALYGIDRALLDLFEKFHYQPWLDVKRDLSARHHLTELLCRRVPEGTFEDAALDLIVMRSGGVVRDLLAIAQSACVEAYLDGADQITSAHVHRAADAFGHKQIQGLRSEELAVLRRVARSGEFQQLSEDDLGLLMTRRVLEYRSSGNARYDVHPTLTIVLGSQ